jgi:uncharacterized protein YciI
MRRHFATMALVVAAMTAALPHAAGVAAPADSASTDLKLFAIVYQPGPVWKRGMPLAQQNLAEHGAYMRSLAARGRLLLAGPLPTLEGGLVIVRAENLDAAQALMAADPAVKNRQFVGIVSEWRAVIDPANRFEGALTR